MDTKNAIEEIGKLIATPGVKFESVVWKNEKILLKFIFKGKIYKLNDTVFAQRSDDAFDLINMSDFSKKVTQIISKVGSYRIDIDVSDATISISMMYNLVHEICVYCEDILIDFKDAGFNVSVLFTFFTDSCGDKLSFMPPISLRFVITHKEKIKFLKDEKEKIIFYKNARGNYDEIELADYIAWLGSYLSEYGIEYKSCVSNSKEISLTFAANTKSGKFWD